ncbi:MAG: LuxR C-terminal-related transcriptional regulator [Agarilytica sp.]
MEPINSIFLLSNTVTKLKFTDSVNTPDLLQRIDFIDSVSAAYTYTQSHSVSLGIIHVDSCIDTIMQFVRNIYAVQPSLNLILLLNSDCIDQQFILDMAHIGITGFTELSFDLSELSLAIEQMNHYGSYIHPKLSKAMLGSMSLAKHENVKKEIYKELTAREITVLNYLTKGFTQKEIAGLMDVSTHTVASHIKNTYRKIGVRNKGEAILYAVKSGATYDPA